MARVLAARVAFGAFLAGHAAGNFIPFADVEELKPRRIHEFCSSEALPGQSAGIRRCAHHFKKQLDDESEIELGWKMDVDPDSILSLDTEAEHGVRLHRCGPGELEIELPDSHARHAAEGKIIVGSRFVHGCAHRRDQHLYHRVRKIHSQQRVPGAIIVHVQTEELQSLAHAVPKLEFHFSWMPSEAKTMADYPEMKTDYGLNRPYLAAKLAGVGQRRLWGLPSMKEVENMDGVKADNGGMQSKSSATGAFDNENGVLNLMPKQLSNFGWNWDFFMNTTQEPVFNMDAPGLKGRMQIRQPYIKVHAGIFLNFSSIFEGLTMAPKVNWRFGVRGHGRVQARVLGSMNTTGDAGADPFHAFKLPILQELETPLWFQKIEFATGSLPLSMEPGFKCSATMYHHGRFKGALGVGGRTKGWLQPVLNYDSVKGFDTEFTGQLDDTDLWPPMWLMFTRHFEIGVLLKPSLLMKGDFAGLERATMSIDARPYANVTITRTGTDENLGSSASSLRKLTVYPMRVMGISGADFDVKYQLKIAANGQTVETTPQVNWGQVEYRDHITNFDLGVIAQDALMNTTRTKITVTLVTVGDGTAHGQTVMGLGEVTCVSVVNGECQPSPATVLIKNEGGTEVATVQMAILWQDNPASWLSSKIRGLAFSFPQVILRQDTLTAAFPNSDQPKSGSSASQISLHLLRGGQSYIIGLVGTIGSQQSALAGDGVIEFPPSFTDTWLPCRLETDKCYSPTLQLYAGNTQIAEATLPVIDFSSESSSQSGGAPGEMKVPSTIALSAPGNSGVTIALATMEARVDFTLQSSLFLAPRTEIAVATGGKEQIEWMVSDVIRSQPYTFKMLALRLMPTSSSASSATPQYRSVSGQPLEPITASAKLFAAKCTPREANGLSPAQAPCTFSYEYEFGSGFSAGDQIVLQVVWSAAGLEHQLFSPAIEIGAGRRLLSYDATAVADFTPADVKSTPRRLWSQEAWNARIQQHSNGCNREDLKFKFGLGMLVRGKVDSINVPKGFPMIGGLSEEPELATGFRNIDVMHPGEDAADAFGGKDGILCEMGLCSGFLPGCARATDKQLHYPKIVFDYNRAYHFQNMSEGHFSGLMRQAMAYAFSTLPEMVDVVLQSLNKTNAPEPRTTTKGPQAWWGAEPKTAPAPSATWPARSSPSPAPSPQEDSRLKSAFNKWWSGGTARRLAAQRSSLEVGDMDVLPDELAHNQVRIEFKQGVPFVIDRPLIELMMQHGYFFGLEDVKDDHVKELGPLEITRFYVDSGISADADGAHAAGAVDVLAGVPTTFPAWGATVVLAVVISLALALALRLKLLSSTGHHATNEALDGEVGLE